MPRPDWQAESRAVRNIAEAIERVLRAAPAGASEARLWGAVESCGVERSAFDRALQTLVTRRVVRRTRGRVFPIGGGQ